MGEILGSWGEEPSVQEGSEHGHIIPALVQLWKPMAQGQEQGSGGQGGLQGFCLNRVAGTPRSQSPRKRSWQRGRLSMYVPKIQMRKPGGKKEMHCHQSK